MKDDWKKFEDTVFKLLCELVEDNSILHKYGDSDSTGSDIIVSVNDKHVFSIEVKMAVSQSSQFALTEENESFTFSLSNKVDPTEDSQVIINYLNSKYKTCDIDQNGKVLEVDSITCNNWIKHTLVSKQVRYVITLEDGKIECVSVDNFDNLFDEKCIIRRKKYWIQYMLP